MLFLATVATATKNVGFAAAIGTRAQLDLQSLADRVPILRRQLLFKSLELALGRSHDVLPLSCFEEVQVLFRDHAAIQRPNALRLAIAGFHRLDNFFQGGRIVPIPGEHFIAQRQAATRHDQADADLLAVGAMIA